MTELDPALTDGNGKPHKRRAILIGLFIAISLGLAGAATLTAVNANQAAANRAEGLARAIQQERVRAIRQNCEDQNMRHKQTIRALDKAIADAVPPSRRRRALRGRDSTVSLINALAPLRDCEALVRRQASVK